VSKALRLGLAIAVALAAVVGVLLFVQSRDKSEVDTAEQRSWTVQLTDAAEQAPDRPLAPRTPLGTSRPPTTLSPPPSGSTKP